MIDALHQLDLEAIARRLLEAKLPVQACVDLAHDFGRAVEALHAAGVDENRPLRAWLLRERDAETGACVVVARRANDLIIPVDAAAALTLIDIDHAGGADVAVIGRLPVADVDRFEL